MPDFVFVTTVSDLVHHAILKNWQDQWTGYCSYKFLVNNLDRFTDFIFSKIQENEDDRYKSKTTITHIEQI